MISLGLNYVLKWGEEDRLCTVQNGNTVLKAAMSQKETKNVYDKKPIHEIHLLKH